MYDFWAINSKLRVIFYWIQFDELIANIMHNVHYDFIP